MAALSVEHLKVMAASRACLRILSMAALSVEHLKVLWSSASGPYGRAPKGDGGQSSLLTHPLDGGLISRAPKGPMVERLRTLSVEHLKVMAASRACLRILFNLLIWCQISNQRAPKGPLDGGLISRAPKGDGGQSSLLAHDGGPLQFTYWPLKLSNQWSST